MKLKRKYLYTIIILVAIIVIFEILSRLLLSPNLVVIKGEHTYLIKTTWDQTGDYAAFVKYDDDTGCWATAIAQIAHYHRLNPFGKIEYTTSRGNHISENLNDYSFNHEQFDKTITVQTAANSKEKVAKYIYYIAAIIYTDFGSSGYLEHETMMSRIEKHLNCSVGFYEYQKQNYLNEQNKIRSLIKNEIDAQRPLMLYFDNADDFGHAAVLDGYIENNDRFLVHLNMGWGGRNDGWYDPFKKIIGIRDDLQNRFLITFNPNK